MKQTIAPPVKMVRRFGARLGKLSILLVGFLPCRDVQGGTVSPVQSNARPFGLDIVAPVQLAGSDARAADFMENALPDIESVVNANLGERESIPNVSGLALDPSALQLQFDSNVRAYFIGEGAGYHNTLGFFTTPYDAERGLAATDAQLIFPDASSSVSYLDTGSTSGTRSQSAPLLVGDFVDLGLLTAGTAINPFLISNGANGGTDVYTAFPDQNPDGIQHFVSLAVTAFADSPYLVIGIEDLRGGGDRDFNDLVFVLDIGVENVAQLVAATVPLPPSVAALIGPSIMGLLVIVRRKRRAGHSASLI